MNHSEEPEPDLDQSKIPEMMDKAEEAYKTYLVESGLRFSILNEKLNCVMSELHMITELLKESRIRQLRLNIALCMSIVFAYLFVALCQFFYP